MTTEIALNDKKLEQYLKLTGVAQNLTAEETQNFFEIAKEYGLNPFKREIYISKYGSNCSIITGYEVYIKRAERSGQLDGWSATTFGSVATNDLKATVTIHRKDRSQPFVWEALYDECVQKTREGRVTKFWEKANFMTKKVAISEGFRLCFSDELGGMPYTSDEMPTPEETQDITHVEVIEPIPVMNDKQLSKLLKEADKERVRNVLKAIEDGRLEATQKQVLDLENKLKTL